MKKDEVLRKVTSKWVMKRRERYIVLEGIRAEIDMIDLLRL
jgi:hypothetical protein